MIIDIRSRLNRSSRPGEPEKHKIVDVEARNRRLHRAGAQAARLKTTTRTQKSDRAVLARNLGYMFQRAHQRAPNTSLRQVFSQAFGDQIGESHYKKRKRYIRLPDDDDSRGPASDTYTARGADYLEIAEAIAHLDQDPTLDDELQIRLSRLRLIEGTSFEDRQDIRERYKQEQIAEFRKRIDQVIERLTSRVDLDWMREWSQRYPILIDGPPGEIQHVSLSSGIGWGAALDIHSDDLSEGEGVYANRIAPKVRIGCIYSPLTPEGYVRVRVPCKTIDNMGETGAIVSVLNKQISLLSVEEHDFNSDVNVWAPLSDARDWKWHGAEEATSLNHPIAWMRRYIELEVRFHPETDRWILCIVVRLPRLFDVNAYSDFICEEALFSEFSKIRQQPVAPCIRLGLEQDGVDSVFAARRDIASKSEDRAALYDVFKQSSFITWAVACDDFLRDEVEESVLMLRDSAGIDFVLAQMQDSEHKVVYDIENPEAVFTPAPYHSIAGAILRNLAYAPKKQRLDTVLIEDARYRFDKIQNLAKATATQYTCAISKFDPS